MTTIQQQTLLVLAANPYDTQWLRLDEEVREIAIILKLVDRQGRIKFESEFAVRSIDLQRLLLEHESNIVHVIGHASTDDGIQLDDDFVSGEALADLFELIDNIDCVVLNSCNSEKTARQIAQKVPFVVGMNGEIADEAAIRFAVGFYTGWAAEKSIRFAYRLGCNAIRLANLPEHSVPILFTADGIMYSDHPVEKGNKSLTIKIDRDFDTFRPEDLSALVQKIREILEIDDELILKNMKRGCVELTIELPESKAEHLLELVSADALNEYDVIDIRPTDPSEEITPSIDESISAEFPDLIENSNNAYEQINYYVLFRDNITRTAQTVLEQLESLGGSAVPRDVRDLALHNLSYMLAHGAAWDYTRKSLVILAPKMEQEGHRDDWLPLLQQGIEQSQLYVDKETEGELRFQLGILYQLLGQFEEAAEEMKLSVACFADIEDRSGQVKALNRWAYVARLQRRFEPATQLLSQVEDWLEESDDQWAYTYFVQGAIAFDQRNWAQAASLFEQSLTLWRQQDDKRMVAWSLTNLGAAVRKLEQHQKAIGYYTQAIDIFEEVNDALHQAIATMNLGNVHEALQEYEQADDLYTKAEFIFREMQDELRLAMVYTNIGVVHRHMQNWSWARMSLLDAIERWQQIGNTKSLINAVVELGRIYEEQGLYAQATTKYYDALNSLSKMKDEPGYGALLKEVTGLLTQVQARVVDHSPTDERTPPP